MVVAVAIAVVAIVKAIVVLVTKKRALFVNVRESKHL